MQKILIIAFTDLKNDSRVYRQIDFLKEKYKITTVGLKNSEIENVDFYQINPILRSNPKRFFRAFDYKLRRFDKIYWSLFQFNQIIPLLLQKKFDLIIANDIETMPLALKIKKKAKVVLDAHEYSPRHFEDQFIWRFFFQDFNKYLCSEYMHKCNKIITVTQGVANEYKKNYGVDPVVITNAVGYVGLLPTKVDNNYIRIITHGVANPNRRLELMIKTMDYVDHRYHLDLMLVPAYPKYYKYLQKLTAKRKNVSIIPPVKQKEIISFTNIYDLSFLIFKPYTINFKYGLGNKTFESLQARLGLVTGVSPEPQAEIVNKYGCGIVLDSFEPKQIALHLNKLTDKQIFEYKKKAHITAGKLTAKKNMEKLGRLVKNLIKNSL